MKIRRQWIFGMQNYSKTEIYAMCKETVGKEKEGGLQITTQLVQKGKG